MVKRRAIQSFENHLFCCYNGPERMVLETLVNSPFNHLTRLKAQMSYCLTERAYPLVCLDQTSRDLPLAKSTCKISWNLSWLMPTWSSTNFRAIRRSLTTSSRNNSALPRTYSNWLPQTLQIIFKVHTSFGTTRTQSYQIRLYLHKQFETFFFTFL
jgi:hypothetical protein